MFNSIKYLEYTSDICRDRFHYGFVNLFLFFIVHLIAEWINCNVGIYA